MNTRSLETSASSSSGAGDTATTDPAPRVGSSLVAGREFRALGSEGSRFRSIRDTARLILEGDIETAVGFFGADSADVLEEIADYTADGRARVDQGRLIRLLIDLMATGDQPIKRQYLIEFLAEVARTDVRLLALHTEDPRWFVVRNVVIALTKSRNRHAYEPILAQVNHQDHRVRVEVLRALAAFEPEASLGVIAQALRDRNPVVRDMAVSLLRASPSVEVIGLVAEALSSSACKPEMDERLINVLVQRNDAEVVPTLEELARYRSWKLTRASMRRAAQRALDDVRSAAERGPAR